MIPYCTANPEDPLLIMDDVLTTGGSLERVKKSILWFGEVYGVVVFSRLSHTPMWIHPMFISGLSALERTVIGRRKSLTSD